MSRWTCPTPTAPRPVEAKIALRVGEPGGRTIERSVVTLPIRPKGPVDRREEAVRRISARAARASFDVVFATPDGAAHRPAADHVVARAASTSATSGSTRTAAGASSPSARRAASPTARSTSPPDAPARIAAPVQWGTYRLDVARRRRGRRHQRRLHRRLVRRRHRRDARPAGHVARQGRLRRRRHHERAHRPALRGQGDASP